MGGKKVPPQIQRMRSDDLLAAVFPEALACQENISGDIEIPDHPLVRETMKDALTEAMDVDGLKTVLGGYREPARIRCVAVDTPVPSQFSHEILNANPYAYLDDAPLEERRARAVEMRRMLPEAVLSEIGRLDPAAIAEVRDEAWPDVRDADELHDALQTLVAFPGRFEAAAARPCSPSSAWSELSPTLVCRWPRRVRARSDGAQPTGSPPKRATTFTAIFPDAQLRFDTGQKSKRSKPSREDALFAVRHRMDGAPRPGNGRKPWPVLGTRAFERRKNVAAPGSRRLHLARPVHRFVWRRNRMVRPPPARAHSPPDARSLRKQIQPVTAAQFMRWLLRWQHVTPETQLLGERGTLEALQQLQGFEAPANAWEQQILARRIANYDPKVLDQLCLTGAVGWGRLSPHPATLAEHGGGDSPRESDQRRADHVFRSRRRRLDDFAARSDEGRK